MARKKTTPDEDASGQQAPAAGAARREPKQQATFNLPAGLIDRLRNVVYWTPGITAADIAEEGLSAAVARYEQSYKKKFGEDVPPRSGHNKAGRPMGAR